jgi:O-antigen/teichoic acid export membrane protein
MVLRYLLVLAVARHLSVADFGVYSTVLAVVAVTSVLTMGGWPSLLMAVVPKFGLTRALLRKARYSVGLLSVGLGIVQAVVLWVSLRNAWSIGIAAASTLVLLGLSLATLENEALRADGLVVRSRFAYAIVYPGVSLLLLLVVAASDVPLSSALVLTLSALGWVALFAVSRGTSRKRERAGEPEDYRVTHDRRAFLATKIAQSVLGSADVLFVSWLAGLEEAALYAVAKRISIIAGLGLNAVTMVYGPRLSSAAVDEHALKSETRRATLLSLCLTLPTVLLLGAISMPLLSTFGTEYEAAWPVLVVLLVGSGVNALAGPIGTVVNVNGQERFSGATMTAFAALYVVAAPLGVVLWGAIGCAVVWASVTALWNLALWIGTDYGRSNRATRCASKPRHREGKCGHCAGG